MNNIIITRFEECRPKLLSKFKKQHPDSYIDIVKTLVRTLSCDDLPLDADRITVIDHGDYQGSQLFVIAALGYQPSDYWATECSYGSCSGCDTLQAIHDMAYDNDTPTDEQARDYLTLALHLTQKMVKLFD